MTSIFVDYSKQILIIDVKKLFYCFICFALKKKFENLKKHDSWKIRIHIYTKKQISIQKKKNWVSN